MKNTKASIDPRAIGKPIEALAHEGMKDPEYRRHYMLYQVRASIASMVQALRKARGMTQAELAKRAGVPQPQIARLEGLSGGRIPRLEQLVRIFAALDSRASLSVFPPSSGQSTRRDIVLV